MAGASESPISDITRELAVYISGAPRRELPAAVSEKTRFHILDTLASAVACRDLEPSTLARKFALAHSSSSAV